MILYQIVKEQLYKATKSDKSYHIDERVRGSKKTNSIQKTTSMYKNKCKQDHAGDIKIG